MFGGGAGGAKTFLGCAWLTLNCINYEGSRWLMGRSDLKTLKLTTLKTFYEVNKMWGFEPERDFNINLQDGVIKYKNGSEIVMMDLKFYPSRDPNFDRLGSLEITGGFIDEANQVIAKAKNIVSSRCRFKLDEFGLIPKMLYTCNPAKNWVYYEFYKPSVTNELDNGKAFVQALAKDNPFISKHYIEQLKRLDPVSKERLYFGNWEYDDDPTRLFDYNEIQDIFTNKQDDKLKRHNYYLSCDVARLGKDQTVIMLWYGLQVKKIIVIPKCTLDQISKRIEELEQEFGISRRHVVIDEDGVGGGVVDMLKGCVGFVNNSKAKFNDNYKNLKTECYFKLQELVRYGDVSIQDRTYRDLITEELSQIKQKNIDKDQKIQLLSKAEIKESLDRSPDFADTLMMRMYFELSGKSLSLSDASGYNIGGTIMGDLMNKKF